MDGARRTGRTGLCEVCGGTTSCRCEGCRESFFCSVWCQKISWENGHCGACRAHRAPILRCMAQRISPAVPAFGERAVPHFVVLPSVPRLPEEFSNAAGDDSSGASVCTIDAVCDRLTMAMARIGAIRRGTVVTMVITTRRAASEVSRVMFSELTVAKALAPELTFRQTQGLAIGLAANALMFQLRGVAEGGDDCSPSGHCLVLAGRVVKRDDRDGFAFRFDGESCIVLRKPSAVAGSSVELAAINGGRRVHYGFAAFPLERSPCDSALFFRGGAPCPTRNAREAFTPEAFEEGLARSLTDGSLLGRLHRNGLAHHPGSFCGTAKEARSRARALYAAVF